MADTENDNNVYNSSPIFSNADFTSLNTKKVVSPTVEDQYDLCWPPSQGRDLTQIISNNTTTTVTGHTAHKSSSLYCNGDEIVGTERRECPEVILSIIRINKIRKKTLFTVYQTKISKMPYQNM